MYGLNNLTNGAADSDKVKSAALVNASQRKFKGA